MLYTKTVEPTTFDILKKVFEIKALNGFAPAGGTALSLKMGHRISVDIDLFSVKKFENERLINVLKKNFSSFEVRRSGKMGVFGYIEDLKTDCIPHQQFKMLRPFEVIDGIRFFSNEDIAAMKVFAIIQRAKKKDYWDLNQLLNHFSFEQIVGFYLEKYPDNTMMISVAEAISKYHLVDDDYEEPICLNRLKWVTIKQNIGKKIDIFFKS